MKRGSQQSVQQHAIPINLRVSITPRTRRIQYDVQKVDIEILPVEQEIIGLIDVKAPRNFDGSPIPASSIPIC